MASNDRDQAQDDRSVLGRLARIVDTFAEDRAELGLGDLVEATGLPRSTIHRFAERLVAMGWLDRSAGGYRVGLRLFEVGSRMPSVARLRAGAAASMHELAAASKSCAQLALLDDHDIVYVDKVSHRETPRLPSRIGGRMPAHCTALGKSLLAFSGPDQVDLRPEHLTARTPFTIVAPARLERELIRIADRGIAIDLEEAVRGVACVAAPIRGAGRAIAAVSISGYREGFDLDRMGTLATNAANQIWSDMFCRRSPRQVA